LAVVVALVLVGAACGDDDDDTAAADQNAGGSAADDAGSDGGGAGAGGDAAVFCHARVQLEQQFSADQPDVEAITALLDDLEAAAPAELSANATGLADVLAGAVQAGSDPTEDPAFGENIAPIDEFALAECGFDEVDVTAVDYRFEGLPETVDAGTVGFKLTNQGAEPHVLILYRFNDGDTTALTDLLALPEDQMAQHGSFAAAAFADPGGWGASFVALEPGRYGVFCPIPVGGAADGAPHFTHGMAAELEVT
jgi:hypothetical protein